MRLYLENLSAWFQKTFISRPFKSAAYWDARYRTGGNSGEGSYAHFAAFKAEVLNSFVRQHGIECIIEFGTGDGAQLMLYDFKNYKGYDVSQNAIKLCRKLYKDDKSKRFELLKKFNSEKAELTLSTDVIYHLIEDYVYNDHMSKLFDASTRYVIIYSSNYESNLNNTNHVRHRKFTDWVEKNKSNFKVIEKINNKYPYDANTHEGSLADFYIYEKSS